MSNSSEKRRQCKDFSELRAGMEVVDTNCQSCGRSDCRSLLVLLHEPDNDEAFWERVPPCRQDDPDFMGSTGEEDVRAGRIFIVEEGEGVELTPREIGEPGEREVH